MGLCLFHLSLQPATHQRSASTDGCVSTESPPISPPILPEFISPPEKFNVMVDPGGRTALHLAIVHQHPKVVDVLLDNRGKFVMYIQIVLIDDVDRLGWELGVDTEGNSKLKRGELIIRTVRTDNVVHVGIRNVHTVKMVIVWMLMMC